MNTRTDTTWLAVAGSRRRADREHVETRVALELARLEAATGGPVGVVSGGARGVDSWAVGVARRTGRAWRELLPELGSVPEGAPRWAYTRRYHERNAALAAAGAVLLAFVAPDRTGGTENTLAHARRLGRPVLVDGDTHYPERERRQLWLNLASV